MSSSSSEVPASSIHPWLWETSSGVVAVGVCIAEARREQFSGTNIPTATTSEDLPQPGMERRGEGILRMEITGISEEDDIDSQDSNTLIDHDHLAQNCSIKIITPAVKTSVISLRIILIHTKICEMVVMPELLFVF